MSKKSAKPPQFGDTGPIDEMGVASSTDMTGGIPALLTPMQRAAVFEEVFNLEVDGLNEE